MTVAEVAQELGLEVLTGHGNLSREVTGGCVSDLLSYVMGSAAAGNLWITIQVHPNVVGVAELLDLSAVVVAHGQGPEEATVSKAREQGIPLLVGPQTAFELAGKLYALIGSGR
ncbi:MAG: serine kinase [Armatimonadota bacterium]